MKRSDERYPGFWHAVVLCVLFVGLQGALMTPVTIVDTLVGWKLAQHPAVLGVVNLVAFAGTMAVAAAIGRFSLGEVMRFRRVRTRAVLGVIGASGGAVIVLSEADNLVRTVLPPPEWMVELFDALFMPGGHVLASAFLLVIVAPVTEELLFRGVILRGFLRRFGSIRAILLSALLFGAIHLNPWQFVSASALGVLFGWWYLRTRSLFPSLLGHALVNAMAWGHALLPFEIRGFNTEPSPLVFQPLWFDAIGGALVAIGLWLFYSATPSSEATPERPDKPSPLFRAPPIIGAPGVIEAAADEK